MGCSPVFVYVTRIFEYGVKDGNLDFIINYDIKYRMGEELATDENE